MNATQSLKVTPDIGGMLHLIFSPGNPLAATITAAPMLPGRPGNVDIHKARLDNPGAYLVSYNPKDRSSTVMPLSSVDWFTPKLFQQHINHIAITRALGLAP